MRTLQAHQLTAWSIFALIIGGYLTLALKYPVGYIWATYEDMYGEWTQLYLFVTVTLSAAWLVFRGGAQYRPFFILLTVAGFFTAGEEISWGQRLLNIDSPEFFEEYNIQGETNVHNFFSGPVSALSKDIVEYVLATSLVTFGLIYPWLLRRGCPVARRVEAFGIAAPPLYLAPFFVIAAPLEMGLVHFNLQEVGEILVGSGLVCMNFYYLGRSRSTLTPAGAFAARTDSRTVAAMTLLAFVIVGILAVSTTRWVYSIPRISQNIDYRVTNGMVTFAGRYENFGLWPQAADLYEQAYTRWPLRLDLLRSLTMSYKMIGDEERYRQGYLELIERTPAGKEKGANVVQINLSRAESYRHAGEPERVEEFLRIALEMAEALVKFKPEDAAAAYWLGRARQQRGDNESALQAYRRALELDPDSLTYAVTLQSAERRQVSPDEHSE